jgi:hypothetical protein
VTDSELFERRLTLGWRGLSPPEGLKQRVRARVRMPVSPWQGLRASGALGVGAGALLVALGFGAGYSLRPPQVVEAAASGALQVTPPQVGTTEETRPPVLERPDPETSPAAREPAPLPQRVAGRKRQAMKTDADGGELRLIQRAERAVRAKNPELALALSDELAERYPRSALHEERGAILLMARCQVEGSDTAADRERFARRYPGSVYTDRITSECEITDGAAGGKHAQPPSR